MLDKRTFITGRQKHEVAYLLYSGMAIEQYPTGLSPVWSMLGPVLRVGVPLDWICHFEPVSSDVQLQKDGSVAQPKSQANHRNAANMIKQDGKVSGGDFSSSSLLQKEKLPRALGFTWDNDLRACHDMTAGYTLGLHPLILQATNTRGQQRTVGCKLRVPQLGNKNSSLRRKKLLGWKDHLNDLF